MDDDSGGGRGEGEGEGEGSVGGGGARVLKCSGVRSRGCCQVATMG